MEWFISDTHFRHSNILEFEDRPFETIEEMEEKMIENWNAVVKKTDTVYFIGDFCFGGIPVWQRILDQLKGEIHLIMGNHDKTKIVKRMYNEDLIADYYEVGKTIKKDSFILHLTHYPLLTGLRHRRFNLMGHVHSNEQELQPYHINVGVDGSFAKRLGKPFGTPISMDEMMEEIAIRHEIVQELLKKEPRGETRN